MSENEKWLKMYWDRWHWAIAQKRWALALKLARSIQAMMERTR